MRILILSNFYPPTVRGGYELRCSETAAELARRGHEVAVLTSRNGDQPATAVLHGVEVSYGLHLEADPAPFKTAVRFFLYRTRHERENQATVQSILAHFRPDVVFVWGMWNVPRSVPFLVERLCPGRVVYHISDYWPMLPSAYRQYWEKLSGRRFTALPKKLIGQMALGLLPSADAPSLRFEYPTCVSLAVKSHLVASGVPIAHATVLHSGVGVNRFKPPTDSTLLRDSTRLVYAGRLTPDKGVHVAIDAVRHLWMKGRNDLHLDIIGDGDAAYIAHLKNQVNAGRTPLPVHFLGKFSKPQMPDMLADYDVLLFPSEWEEPFAGVVMEAMATGLVVVGTPTGGTAEILIHEETGLVFPAGDAIALASAIERLMDDPLLAQRLAENGRMAVQKNFTRARMVDRFEAFLQDVIARDQATPIERQTA